MGCVKPLLTMTNNKKVFYCNNDIHPLDVLDHSWLNYILHNINYSLCISTIMGITHTHLKSDSVVVANEVLGDHIVCIVPFYVPHTVY